MMTAADRRAEFLGNVPQRYRALVAKTFEGATSPRQAIKAKCLDCCHFQRAEIRCCGVVTCPLHAYRPYQTESAEAAE
jgi:hypothetical protein